MPSRLEKIKKTEKTWKPGLEWMIFGQVPAFAQVIKDIEERFV